MNGLQLLGARLARSSTLDCQAVARPLLQRRRESFVQRLLGEIVIPEQAIQRSEHRAR